MEASKSPATQVAALSKTQKSTKQFDPTANLCVCCILEVACRVRASVRSDRKLLS